EDSQARILDIGTGSGAIALAVLKERPGVSAVATDVSSEALALAKKNAEVLGLSERVAFREGSLLEPVEVGETFEVVASNPPYIAEAEMVGLMPDVREFEPRGALTPGGDGLALVRQIIEGAGPFVKPGGLLLIEIGATQGEAAYALAEAAGAWQDIEVRRDLAGLDRTLIARRRDH
ncbi:MAG: peptide chain release factor N(5)-glutamine methyltransferase, partial [Chrysiogenetes bacterium]|nr:peptide chain release factor N(5)-glutamine methyltransferase [Chrysiogenetes bacterium]